MTQTMSRRGSETVSRALILDRRAVMGTEICRSLARKGCAVDVLAEASSPAFYSRFCARRFPTPPCESGEPFRNAVRDVVRDTRYDAVFVCNEEVLEAGAIDVVSPTIGDIHKVWNGRKWKTSVSLHLYGGNIGTIKRHAFGADAKIKTFQSGYSLDVIPNVWSE